MADDTDDEDAPNSFLHKTPPKAAEDPEARMARIAKRSELASTSPVAAWAEVSRAWLADKTEDTLRAYRGVLRDFGRFCGMDPEKALLHWVTSDTRQGYQVLMAYRTDMLERMKPDGKIGLSPSTINQRLSVLRSLSKAAAQAQIPCSSGGRIVTGVSVPNVKALESHAMGITDAQWGQMLREVRGRMTNPGTSQEKGARRDMAMLRLMRDVALRRKEVAALKYQDVDWERRILVLQPKGPKAGRKLWAVGGRAWECVVEWAEVRGDAPGNLFGLGVRQISRVLRDLGDTLGFRITPHMLRHNGVTAVDRKLAESGEKDVTLTQKFARHADPRTTMRYIDTDFTDKIRELHEKLGEDGEDE